MTTNAEEAPFIAAMEHEPEAVTPGYQDVTVTVLDSWTKKFWRADGFISHMLSSLNALGGKVRSLAEGPLRDPESEYERGVRTGVQYGGYREAPKPDNNIKTVIVSCTVALLSAFFIGAWKLSNDSAALRAEFNEWKTATNEWKAASERRMERLENRRP